MSEQAKHTPGPWAWGSGFKPGDSTGSLYGVGGRLVIDAAGYENMWFAAYDKEYDAANAHLIAAAPELLEALQFVMDNGFIEESENIAAAAIAKALGQEGE